MNSRLALVTIVCLLGSTCEPGGEPEASAHGAVSPPSTSEADPTSPPGRATAKARLAKGTAVYEDLVALLHLADFHGPAGLLIDFGTASRLKYTNGNWNSGWLGESREGGATVSTFGRTARLYLPVESRAPMRLRFRAKPYANTAVIDTSTARPSAKPV